MFIGHAQTVAIVFSTGRTLSRDTLPGNIALSDEA